MLPFDPLAKTPRLNHLKIEELLYNNRTIAYIDGSFGCTLLG